MSHSNSRDAYMANDDFTTHSCPEERGFYAVVPSQILNEQADLLDQLISFAFDTLGARHFELRVCAAE
jgi:hypothetical protein